MHNNYFILTLLLANISYSQLFPNIAPEKINFVDYSSVYTKDTDKCIISINTKPAPGFLLNKPFLGSCSEYRADIARLQLPANTYPMCSLDPNWVISNLPLYSAASIYWYPIKPATFFKELKKCVDDLKLLDPDNIVQTMYGLNAKRAFCRRHVEFNVKIFGYTDEIKNLKLNILNTLNTDFPGRSTNELLFNFVLTSTCVGTNLNGCIKMWERLLEEKDNCILNTLGYKINGEPSTWLYGDGLDIQLTQI